MKNLLLACLFTYLLFMLSQQVNAQIGVNTDGTNPDPSAMLDVKSTTKGLLPPRMTFEEMNAIVNPASGLMVYCTDCGSNGSGTLAMFINGMWFIFNANCLTPGSPAEGTHIPSSNQIVWNWNAVSWATGYKWSSTNDYATAIDLGVVTTKTETGLSCNTPYTRYVWAYNACGTSTVKTLTKSTLSTAPLSPTAGTHISTSTQIVWKWEQLTGVSGYKWNTTDDYSTAIDMGTNITKTETDLTCNTSYSRYIWSYTDCGNSIVTILNQSTLNYPPESPSPGIHEPFTNQITWKWNIVVDAVGFKWNTSNNYITAIDLGTNTTHIETGLNCNTPYTRYVWSYSDCGTSTPTTLSQSTISSLSSPMAGTHVPTMTQIVWNWNPIPDATGYKWNTVNNFSTATNMGSNTSKAEPGLLCNTSYTRYVWAYNSCGLSNPTVLTQSTTSSPPIITTGPHNADVFLIIWNWTSDSPGLNYKWNTTDDFWTATSIGTGISYTEEYLDCNTEYTRYLWAYSSCWTSQTMILTQMTLPCPPPCPGIPSVYYEGLIYNTVQIGSQCWLKENLNVGLKINGAQEQTNNGIIEKYCYENNDAYCDVYGGLYQWNELMQYITAEGAKGICPMGWHIPTDLEWTTLTTHLGGESLAGNKLKEMGASHWMWPNTGATNSSGFTALPSSLREINGSYPWPFGTGLLLWSSTQSTQNKPWYRSVSYSSGNINRSDYFEKGNGLAVRCLKDN